MIKISAKKGAGSSFLLKKLVINKKKGFAMFIYMIDLVSIFIEVDIGGGDEINIYLKTYTPIPKNS